MKEMKFEKMALHDLLNQIFTKFLSNVADEIVGLYESMPESSSEDKKQAIMELLDIKYRQDDHLMNGFQVGTDMMTPEKKTPSSASKEAVSIEDCQERFNQGNKICSFILTAGNRKGLPCGKKAARTTSATTPWEEVRCSNHSKEKTPSTQPKLAEFGSIHGSKTLSGFNSNASTPIGGSRITPLGSLSSTGIPKPLGHLPDSITPLKPLGLSRGLPRLGGGLPEFLKRPGQEENKE